MLPAFVFFFDMEQSVLVLVSVLSKILITQCSRKKELLKYQAQKISRRKCLAQQAKELFVKTASSVDELLSCPRIKFSVSKSIFDGVEIGLYC